MHRVELVWAVTSAKNHPCTGILNRKTDFVKFDSNKIFTSKRTNRNKILD